MPSLVFDEAAGRFIAAQDVTESGLVASSLIDDYGEDWLLFSADPTGNDAPSASRAARSLA